MIAGAWWWWASAHAVDDQRAVTRELASAVTISGTAIAALPRLHASRLPSDATIAPRLFAVGAGNAVPRTAADSTPAPTEPTTRPEPPVAHASVNTATPFGDVSIQRLALCDPFGHTFSVGDALQDCIDRAAPFSTLQLPAGVYELDRQLVVTRPITLTTAGAGSTLSCVEQPDRCAIFTAAAGLLADNGMLVVASTRNVTLEHVVLDGNRAARTSSVAARFCLDGRTTAGFNAAFLECENCHLEDVVSRNALCGSGMVWSGRGALIQRNAFIANGDAANGMWADGLTLLYVPDSEVRVNRLVDNSDVALIVGYAPRSRIEENLIQQQAQPAFAGLMLHNFDSDDLGFRGDFRDSIVSQNVIDCGVELCDFGIQVGPRPWNTTRNIIGGDVQENSIRGAKIGINADGAGTSRAPTRIFGNDVNNVPDGEFFAGCANRIPTGWMNIAPTSAVDRHGEGLAAAAHLSEPCELSHAPAVPLQN